MQQTGKQLILLRHAKSDWNAHTNDFDRPLKKRGRQNAKQIGLWLETQELLPDLVISSPAQRALDTAIIICNSLEIATDSILTDESIYAADLSDLLQIVSSIHDSVQRCLLVGHNPGLEELLRYFVVNIPIPADGKLLPTASLATIQLDQYWETYQGSFLLQRPKDLIG